MLEAFDEPVPPELQEELMIQRMAQETGWTFEYIESLSPYRKAAFWALRGGQAKAREHKSWLRSVRGRK